MLSDSASELSKSIGLLIARGTVGGQLTNQTEKDYVVDMISDAYQKGQITESDVGLLLQQYNLG